jgi:hypothetical protein
VNKSEINEWLTVAGSFSVVAGIIFLGVELHQNNELLAQQARHGFLQNRLGWAEDQYRDESFAEALTKVRNNEALSDVDMHRIQLWHASTFLKWEWEWEQVSAGDLNTIPLDAWRFVFQEYPLAHNGWSAFAVTLDPLFVQYVEDNVISKLDQ